MRKPASEAYLEKLRDPRWQKKRLKILERDDWTCQLCGDKERTLHVHHLEYMGRFNGEERQQPWETHDQALVTLCEKCHEDENDRGDYEQWLLRFFRLTGLMAQDIAFVCEVIRIQLEADLKASFSERRERILPYLYGGLNLSLPEDQRFDKPRAEEEA